MKLLETSIVAVVFALAAAALLDEPTRAVFGGNGASDGGVAFGVRAGDTTTAARAVLSRRFSYVRSMRRDWCLAKRFNADYDLDIYRDRSWRLGSICVASSGGRVVSVAWMFNPFVP